MKLKNNFIIKEVLGMNVAVSVGNGNGDFSGVINLNETGLRIFELIKEEKSEDEIVAALLEEYDTTDELARAEIHNVVDRLAKENLLEE